VILRNSCVTLRCEGAAWAAALTAARMNGWASMDESSSAISAADAEALADAIEEAAGDLGDDMAEVVAFAREGEFAAVEEM
jgi:hypothetical protein